MNTIYTQDNTPSSEMRKFIDTFAGPPAGLVQCLSCGLSLFPVDPATKIPYWKYTEQPGIKTLPALDRYCENYRCYATVPARGGMLAIDIDRKRNGNGFKSIQEYYKDRGADISELSEAPRVKTPGGGLHLWFNYNGPQPLNNEILKRVEVKHDCLVSAPGSVDHRGTYELTGVLKNAPQLPATMRRLLVFRDAARPWTPPEPVKDLQLQEMEKILNSQGHFFTEGQRNRYVYKLSLFAARRMKPQDNVINFCMQYEQPDFSKREILLTIQSAYRTASRGTR